MLFLRNRTLVLFACLFCASVFAAEIKVIQPYVNITRANDLSASVYAQLVNNTEEDRYLVAAQTDAASKAELRTVVSRGSANETRNAPFFRIPPQSTLELSPSTQHIVLLGLIKPLEKNDHINVTLIFKDGQKVPVRVPVTFLITDFMHMKAKNTE